MVGVSITSQEKDSINRGLKLKSDVKELNKYVINTHKEIRRDKQDKIKGTKKVNIDFKKQFAKDTKLKPVIEKESDTCTTKHLSRILICFEEPDYLNRQISITEIHEFTLLPWKIVNEGLKFLTHFKIVTELNVNGKYFYKK